MDVEFTFEKETTTTYRFKENGEKAENVIGTLYVKKSKFAPGVIPAGVTITIKGIV